MIIENMDIDAEEVQPMAWPLHRWELLEHGNRSYDDHILVKMCFNQRSRTDTSYLWSPWIKLMEEL